MRLEPGGVRCDSHALATTLTIYIYILGAPPPQSPTKNLIQLSMISSVFKVILKGVHVLYSTRLENPSSGLCQTKKIILLSWNLTQSVPFRTPKSALDLYLATSSESAQCFLPVHSKRACDGGH